MPRAISLRSHFTGSRLRALARQSKDAAQARRLLALAVIYQGGSRTEAARLGDVTLQIIRDWVLRFNAQGPAGLITRQGARPAPAAHSCAPPGADGHPGTSPNTAIHGVVRWRLCDLGLWLWEEFRLSISPQTLSRKLRAMGWRKLSARPKHHAQALDAITTFKRTSPPRWQASRPISASASTR